MYVHTAPVIGIIAPAILLQLYRVREDPCEIVPGRAYAAVPCLGVLLEKPLFLAMLDELLKYMAGPFKAVSGKFRLNDLLIIRIIKCMYIQRR